MIDDKALAETAEAIRPILVEIDELKKLLDSRRPLDSDAVARLEEAFEVDFVFQSNAIEGNPLTRRETQLILERGLSVEATSLKHHLEVINLQGAYRFVRDLAKGAEELTEENIREIHRIVMKGISDDEAGRYRTTAVRITGAEHEPVEPVMIPEHMERYVSWLNAKHEIHHLLVAAGAHWWVVNIHPFRDGNGRVARLLLNLILWRQGYPIVIVREEDRAAYYAALEAGDGGNLVPFCEFVATSALRTARTYDRALAEQKRAEDLLGGVVQAVARTATERQLAYYEAWKGRMESVKAEFKSGVRFLQAKLSGKIDISFEDFGMIGFDKFVAILERKSVTETWFFRIRLVDVAGREQSYVFWFGRALGFVTNFTRRPTLVSILISRRRGAEWQQLYGPGVPRLREIFEHDGEVYRYYWVDASTNVGEKPCMIADPAAIAAKFFHEAVAGL